MIASTFPAAVRRPITDQLWPVVALSAAMGGIAIAGMLADVRMLDGAGVWAKPLKFSVSFVVYFATLALVVDRLSPAARAGWGLRLSLHAAVVSMLFEMIYMFTMAGQGVRSHFNDSDALHQVAYSLMGLGALVLMLAVGWVGIVAWRDRAARMGPDLRAAVGLGFVASAVLTVIVGFTLGGNNGHFIGVPPDGAAVLPVFGWSAAVGDLRPAHFLGLHAMQVVPLLAIVLQRAGTQRQGLWLWLATLAYAALTLALYAQALAGLPLIRL